MLTPVINTDTSPTNITGKSWIAWVIRVKPAASFGAVPNRVRPNIPPASHSPQYPGTDGRAIKKHIITIYTTVSTGVRVTPADAFAMTK